MPPSIEEDDDDSRDILIHEELLDNYSLPIPENESFHFDIPSFSRPPAKPPDGNTGILNIKMTDNNLTLAFLLKETAFLKVYFAPDEVHAAIVTCGGLCLGLNTVIREIVCALYHMYGVTKVLGIDGGYKGFYSKNTITLTPKFVNDIHKRGGTFIGTSRGGHDKLKIVDSIQDRGINQVTDINKGTKSKQNRTKPSTKRKV
uniref:ATP-dependent 6-phosphofructokinase 6-like n=1 Tax=Tanacetum cinerariifolium TaxID=118510 RepID=A0A6L2MGS8_TANCI|nr:ATP-dependent 6-phosphofructokinase 6-like [Tanacetum cinerariifolium]